MTILFTGERIITPSVCLATYDLNIKYFYFKKILILCTLFPIGLQRVGDGC